MIIPKQSPVIGPANLEQNLTTSNEFLEPNESLVVISPLTDTGIPEPYL